MSDALRYTERGWPVFPIWKMAEKGCACGGRECKSPGKHPIGSLVPNGLKDATTDPETVRSWWREYPTANIGIATGDLIIVDLDGQDGIAKWDALTIRYSDPDTLQARTGGGGIHLYFKNVAKLGNSSHRLASKIDTRGVGGYVLAPNSNHKSGKNYVWLNSADIAPLPTWAIAKLRPKIPTPAGRPKPVGKWECSPYGKAVLASCLLRIKSAPEGQRNEILNHESFIIGQYVGGGEIQIFTNLEDLIMDYCPDPDRKKSVETIRRALKDGRGYPKSAQ